MSEISLELKNIKKSFQEGEDVLESICLTAKKENLLPCWGLPAVENHHTADHRRPGTARFRTGFSEWKRCDIPGTEPA